MRRAVTIIRAKRSHIHAYKRAARALIEARAARFAHLYGVSYRKISIRAQKRRWGSCSRAGNLSFNYKIVLLPPALADYIVVHEICHLKEFNHSPAFWAEVARAVPAHRELRKSLRMLAFRFQ